VHPPSHHQTSSRLTIRFPRHNHDVVVVVVVTGSLSLSDCATYRDRRCCAVIVIADCGGRPCGRAPRELRPDVAREDGGRRVCRCDGGVTLGASGTVARHLRRQHRRCGARRALRQARARHRDCGTSLPPCSLRHFAVAAASIATMSPSLSLSVFFALLHISRVQAPRPFSRALLSVALWPHHALTPTARVDR
jgi:hypothetical protein